MLKNIQKSGGGSPFAGAIKSFMQAVLSKMGKKNPQMAKAFSSFFSSIMSGNSKGLNQSLSAVLNLATQNINKKK